MRLGIKGGGKGMISFVARYADIKCLRTLRSNAVRAWVD